MSRGPRTALALTLAALLVGGAAWLGHRVFADHGEPLAPVSWRALTVAPEDAAAPDAPAASPGPASAPSPVIAAPGLTAAVRERFLAAPDLRVAIEALRRERPVGFGLLMAEGLAFCHTLRSTDTPDYAFWHQAQAVLRGESGESALRARRLQALSAKCAGFSAHEIAPVTISETVQATAADDPAYRLDQRMAQLLRASPPPDLATVSAVADEVVTLGHPRLYRSLFWLLRRLGGSVLNPSVDGPAAQRGAEAALRHVWDLATCEVEARCAQEDLHEQWHCALQGGCPRGAWARAWGDVPPPPADVQASVEALRLAFVWHIRTRNWAWFAQPGNKP